MHRPSLSGTWGHVSQPRNLSGGSVRPSLFGDSVRPIVKERLSSQKNSPSKTKPVFVKEMCGPEPNSAEERYFKGVATACLSSNEVNRAKGLKSLGRTVGIQKLMPDLTSFIVTGVDHCKSNNLSTLFHLIDMTTSLIENQSIALEGFIFDLISAIGTCVVYSEIPVLSPEGDHWKLRNVASRLSGQICQSYNTDSNNLTEKVARCYGDYLRKENVALNSFYGGLVGMKELGPSVVQTWIIPNVKYLSERIDHAKGSSTEINKVERVRGLLIETIEPILKTLEDPPELGSLLPYFQHQAGDSSLQVDPGVEAELHVYGLKYWVTQENIRSNFSEFGVILDIYLSKVGYCHIKYSTREEAAACMNALNGKTILGKKLQIDWATTSKFNENSIYYLFCEKYKICYKFNIEEDGCENTNCPRHHWCLFCYELFRTEENHRSKFECPSQKPGFVRFPPRDKRPQSPQTASHPDGDQLQQSSSDQAKRFKFSKK